MHVLFTVRQQKIDDLDELIDEEAMDFFIVLCRFANYKIFSKEKSMKMEFTANTLGLNLKREETENITQQMR